MPVTSSPLPRSGPHPTGYPRPPGPAEGARRRGWYPATQTRGPPGRATCRAGSARGPLRGGVRPRPTPQLIATHKLPHGAEALAVARGLDRDRAVDESGNQIGVFGRVGARPLSLAEQQQMYLRNGRVWSVSDDPRDPRYGAPRP